jgi:4-hydroxybenzoate polyprenyltransferase
MNWVKAIRPLNGVLLAVPMTLLGFRLVGQNALQGLPYALVVFAIYSATIVWNDYCDKDVDFRKGKTFAHDHAHNFLNYSICWWVVAIAADCYLWQTHGAAAGLLVFGLTSLGLFYTQAQKNVFTKNGTVTIWSSSLLFFPLTKGYSATPKLWWLLLVAALVNCGREVFKDLEDEEYDKGSKGTLPKLIGRENASQCAGLMVSAGSITAIFPFHWVGALLAVFCLTASMSSIRKDYKTTVRILKLGIVLFLGALFM